MLFWLLTVEPSNPGSTSETDPSPADCSPPVPQNTGREAGTSSTWTRTHAPEPEPTRTARRTPKPSGDARRTALFRNVVVLWQSVRTKCDSPKRTEPSREAASSSRSYIRVLAAACLADVGIKRRRLLSDAPIPVEKVARSSSRLQLEATCGEQDSRSA